MTSFLQSQAWGKFQKALGRKVFEYDKENIKALIIKQPVRMGKSFLHIPYGPSMDFNAMISGQHAPIANFVAWLENHANKEKVMFIKIEPASDHIGEALVDAGLKYTDKRIEPNKTVIIDLSKTQDDLFANLHKKTRYSVRVAQDHDVHIKEGNSIDEFWRLLQLTTQRDEFRSHDKNYYTKLYDVFTKRDDVDIKVWHAIHNKTTIAAAVIVSYQNTAYYMYGASDHKYRDVMAPSLLQWEIIKSLKHENMKSYDLFGIDANKWPGVTRFKLRFGGQVVEYPGAYQLTISKFWSFLYNVRRK
jgi:peptidoglycan pentaglycine glycine transferase (the first glycine)